MFQDNDSGPWSKGAAPKNRHPCLLLHSTWMPVHDIIRWDDAHPTQSVCKAPGPYL